MDKRREANIRVKTHITEALFSLMHKKSFSEITVTEIIREAGVARASYYRNYDSKEDVLITLVEDVLEEFRSTAEYGAYNYFSYQNVLRSFSYFKRYGSYVLDLYRCGFASILLEKLNQSREINAGTMPASSIERYHLYMYIGSLFNTAIVWLQSGTKESAEDISAMFCRYVGIPLAKD